MEATEERKNEGEKERKNRKKASKTLSWSVK